MSRKKACPGLDPGWEPVFRQGHAPLKECRERVERDALQLRRFSPRLMRGGCNIRWTRCEQLMVEVPAIETPGYLALSRHPRGRERERGMLNKRRLLAGFALTLAATPFLAAVA